MRGGEIMTMTMMRVYEQSFSLRIMCAKVVWSGSTGVGKQGGDSAE